MSHSAKREEYCGPGGHLVILDFSLPNPPLRALYEIYLNHVLPVLAGWVTGEPDAYYYFAGTIKSFPKGEAMLELLRGCGFVNCDAKPLTMGIVTVYTGAEVRRQESGVQESSQGERVKI